MMEDRIRELETSLGVALHLLNECREALFVFDENHPLIARTENFDIALVTETLSQQGIRGDRRMTRRDQFANAAMAALLAHHFYTVEDESGMSHLAFRAYRMADAMERQAQVQEEIKE